jgi:hypothetical protein
MYQLRCSLGRWSTYRMFRIVFWDILPCIRQYIPEDNSEHHTSRRENLKSHTYRMFLGRIS